jgi:hypothetical protein
MRILRLVLIALLALAWACAGDSAPAGPDASDGFNDPSPDFDQAPSRVHVIERSDNTGSAYGAVITASFSHSAPEIYQERTRSGSCRQLAAEPGFCTEPCEGYCLGSGECVPWPARLSVGTLTMTGTGLAQPVIIEPTPEALYSAYVQQPLIQSGSQIIASAPGAELGVFELAVPGPQPLVVSKRDQLALEAGKPLTIEWIPSSDPAARIRLWLISDYGHGPVHPAVIHCDAPDTGLITIPADWVDWLRDPSHWACGDCFESTMTRYTRATTVVDGTAVELSAQSVVGLYLVPWSF